MTILGLLHRLRVLLAPESYAREVEAEVRFHLELDAMHARGEGLSNEAAEWTARRQFGNVTHVREEVRRMSGMEWIDRLRQDIGYAVRGLSRAPGFTFAVVLTLGLGLGVNAAMFTFLDQVFVRPPAAVVHPSEVRRLYVEVNRPTEATGRLAFALFKYSQIREMARSVDTTVRLGVYSTNLDSMTITTPSTAVLARRSIVNRAFFDVLGIRPTLGRLFDADEDRIDGRAAVAVISNGLWQRGFNHDPQVIGSTFRSKAGAFTVIGVAPEKFSGIDLDRVDFWVALGTFAEGQPPTPPWYETFHHSVGIVARIPSAAAEQRFIDVATRAFRTVHIPRYAYDSTARVLTGPILSALGPGKRHMETSISLRLGGVALIVLLIAAANVSNLLLVRATKRGREIAIRRALGVSRWQLFEQLFVESLLLALIGGGVSVVLAIWAGTALRRLLLPQITWATGALDMRTTLFALAASAIVGILVGLAPAAHAWRADVIGSLKAGNRNGGLRRSSLRSTLLVAQAALSVVLVVGAGLFVRSLRNVRSIDVGYDIDRTIIATPIGGAAMRAAVDAGMPAILSRMSAINGVETVAAVTSPPLQGEAYMPMFLPDRDSLPKVGPYAGAAFVNVTPGFFRAVGIRVLAGRVFSETDGSGVVVSNAMAKGYWPGQSPLGKCIILESREKPCVPVIGVVSDVHRWSVIEDDLAARFYLGSPASRSTIILRTAPDRQASIARILSTELKSMVPQADYIRIRTLSGILEPNFRPWRLGATLFTAMGALALIVAAIGVYSVIAYAVSQRTNEMGIRVALGAQVSDIARLVIGDGLRTVAIGIALGIILSIALGRLVSSVLFGISARDPWVITFAAVVLAVIGLAATIIPALRAARVNPVTALRVD